MGWLEIVKTLAIIGVPIAIAVTGYVVGAMKSLDAGIKATTKSLNEFKTEVARDYVPRKELAEALSTMRAESRELKVDLFQRLDKMEGWMGRRFDAVLGREADKG